MSQLKETKRNGVEENKTLPINTAYLRHDQTKQMVEAFKESKDHPQVVMYAPHWVPVCLEKLAPELSGKQFEVSDGKEIVDNFTVSNPITLTELHKITRNEPSNISGEINFTNYRNISTERVYAAKDLIKHCVTVAKTKADRQGGFRDEKTIKNFPAAKDVYVIDLIGAQFQKNYNYGRLLCISETPLPEGSLDKEIYQHLVGQPKQMFATIAGEIKQANPAFIDRYKLVDWSYRDLEKNANVKQKVYFDTKAYKELVSQDFYLSARAVNDLARKNGDNLDFRFLAYGSGAFASSFSKEINNNILDGILLGLKKLNQNGFPSKIKQLTFPYYQASETAELQIEKIRALCARIGVGCGFKQIDALHHEEDNNNLVVAVTACTDPHVVLTNEGGHRFKENNLPLDSLDAAIGTNLVNCGDEFSPHFSNFNEKLVKIPELLDNYTLTTFFSRGAKTPRGKKMEATAVAAFGFVEATVLLGAISYGTLLGIDYVFKQHSLENFSKLVQENSELIKLGTEICGAALGLILLVALAAAVRGFAIEKRYADIAYGEVKPASSPQVS